MGADDLVLLVEFLIYWGHWQRYHATSLLVLILSWHLLFGGTGVQVSRENPGTAGLRDRLGRLCLVFEVLLNIFVGKKNIGIEE